MRRPLIEVRHSPIHGFGVFAARKIRKGTRIVEYLGERVTHAVADSRHEGKDPNDNHTFLFTVDRRTVIDGGVDGNEARFINHACAPNCESVITARRVFIEAIKTIQAGEELSYDYLIQRDREDDPEVDLVFACRCGAENCRGSMLEPRKRVRSKRKAAPKKPKSKPRSKPARKRGGGASQRTWRGSNRRGAR
jgi:SET domain-containing protein